MSLLRSDGSRDDQAGEAGPVEQSSVEAKSLKLRAEGLSGCHPSGQQLRQPDGGPEGQIKNYSHNNLLKEIELKAALTGSTRRAKGSPPKKAQWLRKEKTLTLGSKLAVVEGGGVNGDEVAEE